MGLTMNRQVRYQAPLRSVIDHKRYCLRERHKVAVGMTILAMSCELADRTWFAEGRIVIGPHFVGESKEGKHECWVREASTAVNVVSNDGTYHRSQVSVKRGGGGVRALPEWRARGFEEIDGGGEGWRDIAAPKSVEELGAYCGYAWYSASYDSVSARSANLFFTHAADRVQVFLRGRSVGVWGRGSGAMRDPLPIELQKGKNEFIFLCDNMGRTSEGNVNDRKGITGPAYLDALSAPLGPGDWSPLFTAPTESWEFRTHRCYTGATESRFAEVRAHVDIGRDRGGLLALRWVPQYTWVCVNGHLIAEHGGDDPLLSGFCFQNYILDPWLEDDQAEIRLVFSGGRWATGRSTCACSLTPGQMQ